MPDTPRPTPAAATLATVRRQLLHAATFCGNLSPGQLDQIAARLTASLRDYATTDTRADRCAQRPLRARSGFTECPHRSRNPYHGPAPDSDR